MSFMDFTAALAAAFFIDAFVGYPPGLFAAIGHPVVWMGWLISALDRRFNDDRETAAQRRHAGVLSLVLLLIVVGAASELVDVACSTLPFGFLFVAAAASSLLASRSLDEHVGAVAVAVALEEGGLDAGRLAVSQIVGRNPDVLDEAGICRAAIESLAENFSDGVVAPALWFAIGGLPGIALYKAINTGDSMIGHRTPRHEAYGWATARLDDLVNLPASRLSAAFIIAAAAVLPGADPWAAWHALRRDARGHRSPNAGWPEAAMAGALGLRLAGPRIYGNTLVQDAAMGDGRAEATPADIRRALALFRIAGLIPLALATLSLGLLLIGQS